MATYNKFQAFVEHMAEGVHNLQSHTLKVMLTLTAPVATNAVKADLTEIAAGNGYSAGGNTATVSSSAQSSGTYKLVLADVTFTASGGSFAAARYFVLYNDTPTSPADPLIGWWDYGSSFTLADGETATWDADPTNGILTVV
jgi:hypothetical protein